MPVVWGVLGLTIAVAALRAGRSEAAQRVGVLAVGVLFLLAGAAANLWFLASGEDYAEFAEGSYLPFVRDTWASLVVPHHTAFIGLLVAFEAVVGVLVLLGGRRAEVGLAAALAFHVALLSFGWGFYLWAVPMIAALARLLVGQHATDAPRAEAPVRGTGQAVGPGPA